MVGDRRRFPGRSSSWNRRANARQQWPSNQGGEEERIVSLRAEIVQELDTKFWVTLFDNTLEGNGDRYTTVADLVDLVLFGSRRVLDWAWAILGF